TSDNGLYAADSCDYANNASLTPNGDPTCGAPMLVSAWGEASGPVAVDSYGDVMAVMTSFTDGTQEARGFVAYAIMRGAPPTNGDTIFTMPGFGSALAAIAPDTTHDGALIFQPSDATSFAPLDPIEQHYVVTADNVTAKGAQAPFLSRADPMASLGLMTDEA